MRVSALLSAFAALMALTVSQAAALKSSPTPRFEPLFVGTLEIGSMQTLAGPFGTRLNAADTG